MQGHQNRGKSTRGTYLSYVTFFSSRQNTLKLIRTCGLIIIFELPVMHHLVFPHESFIKYMKSNGRLLSVASFVKSNPQRRVIHCWAEARQELQATCRVWRARWAEVPTRAPGPWRLSSKERTAVFGNSSSFRCAPCDFLSNLLYTRRPSAIL